MCTQFVIGKSGTIHKLVDTDVRCRHAIGLNYTSIGIEMVQETGRGAHWADRQILKRKPQIRGALKLVRYLRSRFDIRMRNVIGHAMANNSPFFEDNEGWTNTHTDWIWRDVKTFRHRLRKMTHGPAGTRRPRSTRKPIPGSFIPDGVGFWSKSHGVVGGRIGKRGVLGVTRDRGRSWRVTQWTQRRQYVQDVTIAEGGEAWAEAVCDGCKTRLLHSSDGGRHWNVISVGRREDVNFLDAQSGWGLRPRSYDDPSHGSSEKFFVQKTLDGGHEWARVTRVCRPGYWLDAALSRPSEDRAWVACASEPATAMQKKIVLRTVDGGATWTRRGKALWNGHLVGIFFLDDGHGWMWTNRSTVYRTHDGGRTWKGTHYFESDVDFVTSMWFANDNRGFAVGRFGDTQRLVVTHDGGKHWSLRHEW